MQGQKTRQADNGPNDTKMQTQTEVNSNDRNKTDETNDANMDPSKARQDEI